MEESTQNQSETTSLYQHAVRWGLIAGVISVMLTIIYYVIDVGLMVNWKVGLLTFAIYIGFAIYAGIQYRGIAGGFLSYGKAFQHGLILFAISALVSTAFNLVLYSVIDPELPSKLTDAALEQTEAMLRGFGTPEDAIEKAMDESRVKMADQFSAMGMIKSYLWVLIGCAVLALITSLFVRKNEPVDM